MKRIAIQIACAVFFFFLSFKLTIRTPAPSDKRVKTMNGGIDYAAKYAGIKTRREYFAAVFSDPRLQIDSGIVKMAKAEIKGKELIISFSIPNLQSKLEKDSSRIAAKFSRKSAKNTACPRTSSPPFFGWKRTSAVLSAIISR